ncbi:carboxypeptidase regulatory-like domain-containing protein [Candidatus Gracilibacteria bacterium]|nr:carboxypeptidase regulatory-like domain-containing protein [Candidatus Gracilibacteria bacterium]
MNVVLNILKRQGRLLTAGFILWSMCLGMFLPLVFAADIDQDGLDETVDNNDASPLWAPRIVYPLENTGVENVDLQASFRGSGEVGTQVKIFENQDEICAAEIVGNGISVMQDGETKIDSNVLLGEGGVVQFFYDTEENSAWRSTDTLPWYGEERDDVLDKICDYRIGDGDGDPRSGEDDRCGQRAFPLKALLVGTGDALFIFDAETRGLWKKIPLTGITSITALEGVLYVGTGSGLRILDFTNGDLSKLLTPTSTPAIINAAITDVASQKIEGKNFVVIGTQGGVTLFNATDSVTFSKSSGSIVGVMITAENKIAYALINGTFLSSSEVLAVTANWEVENVSTKTNFDVGLGRVLKGDFIGHTVGITHIQSHEKFRNISRDFATIPLIGDVRGHWFNSVLDRSGKGNNLIDHNEVEVSPVAENADVQEFSFDGSSQYLSSDGIDFDVSGNYLTVGMWIKRSQTGGTGAYQKVLNHGESSQTRNYFISAGDSFFDYPIQEDPYFFGVKTEDGFAAASIQSSPQADVWEFVVGTYDGQNVKIYKDGVLEDVVAQTGNIIPNGEDLRIGYGYQNEYFSGSVLLPFVAATSYTQEQIQEIYNLTKNWKNPGAKVTLRNDSLEVRDVTCHPEWNTCYIATTTGITKLDVSTGLTTEITSQSGITKIAATRIGTWACQEIITRGAHTVFARAFVTGNASSKLTNDRQFYVYRPGEADIDGDGLSNEEDNNPFVPIEKPEITLIQQSVEDQQIYTFSGTGDPGTGDLRTRVGIFEQGILSPLFFAEVGAGGAWQGQPITLDTGDRALFAKAYIGEHLSNVFSDQVLIKVQTLEEGPPPPHVLGEFTGTGNLTFSWDKNKTGELFKAQVSTDKSFLVETQESGWIPETSYNFQNLQNGQKYFFRVKSKDANGQETEYSTATETIIDTLAPEGSILSNSGTYSPMREIEFRWTDFTDNGGSGIDHFEITISGKSDFSNILFQDVHYGTTNKLFTGDQGKSYFARVRAVDLVGNKSNYVYSAGTIIDTTPPASFALRTIPNPSPPGAQTLSWDASSDGESGIRKYEIFREDIESGKDVPTVFMRSIGTTTGRSYVDESVQDTWIYVYKITAYNGSGLTVTTPTIQFEVNSTKVKPAAFQNIHHYTHSDSVPLQWIQAGDIPNVSAYQILRNGLVIQTTSDATTRQYEDTEAKVDGTVYQYRVQSKNIETVGGLSPELRVLVDKTPPTSTAVISGVSGGNGWYTSPLFITLTASDGTGTVFDSYTHTGTGFVAGVDRILFNKNDVGVTPYTGAISINANGTNTLLFSSLDWAGNQESDHTLSLKIDSQPPTVTFSAGAGAVINNGFTKENAIDFAVSATDATSGIATLTTYVRFDENGDGTLAGANDFGFSELPQSKISYATTDSDSGTYVFSKDGHYEFKVVATDNAGNNAESNIIVINVDRTPPSTTDNAPGIVPAVAPIIVKLSPNDRAVSSGIAQTYYTKDGVTPTTASSQGTRVVLAPEDIDENGYFVIKYFSVDKIGNVETVKIISNSPADVDEDGLPDSFEALYSEESSETLMESSNDTDGDGLTNLQEYQYNTNPINADTDGDTIIDGTEIADGTDPKNSADHRIIIIAPKAVVQPTDTPFTFLARAPIGKTISIKNSSGFVIGTGTADSSGRVSIELSLVAGSSQKITAEFLHNNGKIVSTKAKEGEEDIFINVQSSTGTNPKFVNIKDGEFFSQGFIDLQVKGKAGARMELFEKKEGNLVSLDQETSNAEGVAELGLPVTFLGGEIFVVDQDNLLTSEILQVYRGVSVSGQILDTKSVPIGDVIVKFIDGDTQYTTTTNSNGNYTINIPRNRTYTVKIYHRVYEKFETTLFISDKNPKISPILKIIEATNAEQTEDGIIYTDSGAGQITRQAGMERADVSQVIQEPTKTYEESLQEVIQLQQGISGEVLTHVTEEGRELFGGYQAGRIAVDEYKVQPEVARKITGLLGAERRQGEGAQGFYATAQSELCLRSNPDMKKPEDVASENIYSNQIYQLNEYGVWKLDEENKFHPDRNITWENVLEFIFAVNCISPRSLAELKRSEIPAIEGIELQNTPESLAIYTAKLEGVLGADFNIKTLPTRQEVLWTLAIAFQLDINEKATNSSFPDVSRENSLAPVLVAAKQNNWFIGFNDKEFKQDQVLTRGEFANWFVNALDYKKTSTTQKSAFQKFIEKLRGGAEEEQKARPGVRTTSRTEAASHLTGRQAREEAAQENQYYQPTRASWNPIDPSTTRQPLWIKDKSENVRPPDTKKVLRDVQKALERVIEKQQTESQSKVENSVGFEKKTIEGN